MGATIKVWMSGSVVIFSPNPHKVFDSSRNVWDDKYALSLGVPESLRESYILRELGPRNSFDSGLVRPTCARHIDFFAIVGLLTETNCAADSPRIQSGPEVGRDILGNRDAETRQFVLVVRVVRATLDFGQVISNLMGMALPVVGLEVTTRGRRANWRGPGCGAPSVNRAASVVV